MTAEPQESRRSPWRTRLVAAALALFLGALGGLWAATTRSSGDVPVRFYPPPEPQADFRLRDQDGRLIRLQEQRGRVVVLTFLYSTCWDLCPAQAEVVRDALRSAGGKGMEVLVVSVDAVGDTPVRTRRFLADHLEYGGPAHFLIGTRPQLEPVWRMYGIAPMDATPEEAAESAAASDRFQAMRKASGAPPEDEAATYQHPKRPPTEDASDPYPSADDLKYRGPTRHQHGAPYEHSAYVLLIDKHGRQRVGFPFEQLSAPELARDVRALVAEP